jgi:hypothetical protein
VAHPDASAAGRSLPASKRRAIAQTQGKPPDPGCDRSAERLGYELVFDALTLAIEGLEIPRDRESLAAAIALRDRLDAKVAGAIGDYAAAGEHEVDGSVAMSAWLRHNGGLDPTSSIVEARRAAKLRSLPVLAAAFEAGDLSAGAVEVILAKVPARHLARFASHEPELVPALAALDVDGVQRAMAEWRARADALDPGPAPGDRPDTLHLAATVDGRGVLNGSLGTDLFNLLSTALRVADPKDFDLPMAERRAAALGQVCQTFLDLQQGFRGGRHRPHVTVTVRAAEDGPPATYTETGMPVDDVTLAALACDAIWHRLVFDRGAVLHYGRSVRGWAADVANAIGIRDGGCRWPGCSAPAAWCDIHHVEPWEHGGCTDVCNGLMLCRRHHRMLHAKPGWSLKLLPDGTVELTHPDGRTERSEPRGLDPPRLPIPDG